MFSCNTLLALLLRHAGFWDLDHFKPGQTSGFFLFINETLYLKAGRLLKTV